MGNHINAKEYCVGVEQRDQLQQQRLLTIPIREDNSPLVSLKDSGLVLIYEPSIKKDYKYLVRSAIVEKIGRISRRLKEENKVLIIRSVWRSFAHQRLLWHKYYRIIHAKYPKKKLKEIRVIVSGFIAAEGKSMHATGGAVDALIFDLGRDRVLDFGTNKGYKINLNKQCYPLHPDISDTAKRNRTLLINLFEREDFVCELKEYWHFDYGNAVWAIEKEKEYAMFDIISDFKEQ